ncbi:RpiB/LacA/LacB family sugar-phosphate isomerase [Sphaerisporangium album]|uniref:RpiB/LacA/LacB family sugar-phosphate isomerase n=1 Tax=Sphaerisporangium album TaxID=509200 RepID=A0A367FM37_9ACTN|nr:RpiB/LacA/LacB family sugar-phosphate isomerase [Sphaerisporangium album]
MAADHNGVAMKRRLTAWLAGQGHQIDDRGTHGDDVVDYPALCASVGEEVTSGRAERGIMIGGTGGGEAIACNKIRGIRAGLCHSVFLAEISSAHNRSNVLVIGAKVIDEEEAVRITEVWLTTPFKGGVHLRRLEQIEALERGDPLA